MYTRRAKNVGAVLKFACSKHEFKANSTVKLQSILSFPNFYGDFFYPRKVFRSSCHTLLLTNNPEGKVVIDGLNVHGLL
jgi:hypothetical protein